MQFQYFSKNIVKRDAVPKLPKGVKMFGGVTYTETVAWSSPNYARRAGIIVASAVALLLAAGGVWYVYDKMTEKIDGMSVKHDHLKNCF